MGPESGPNGPTSKPNGTKLAPTGPKTDPLCDSQALVPFYKKLKKEKKGSLPQEGMSEGLYKITHAFRLFFDMVIVSDTFKTSLV